MFSNIYEQSKLVTKLINKSNRTILFLQKNEPQTYHRLF